MISFCSSIGTGFVNQLGIPVLHLKDQQCHLQAQMEKWIYGETSSLWEDGERVGLGLNGRVEIISPSPEFGALGSEPALVASGLG